MGIQQFIAEIQVIIDKKNDQIRERNAEIKRLRKILPGLYGSLSWRITAPLRKVHALLTSGKSSPELNPGDDTLIAEPTSDRIQIPQGLLTVNTPDQSVKKPEAAAVVNVNPVAVKTVFSSLPDPLQFERETMLDFLIFPIIDWDFRFQRPQQLALQLAHHGHRVFYFKTTFTRHAGEITPQQLEINEIEKNIYQVKLVTKDLLSIYRDLAHGRQPMADLIDSVGALKRRFGIRHTVSVIDHPFWWPVARSLKNNTNIYDCMDDHSGFESNRNILTYEPGLTAEADLVVVSSDILLKKTSITAKRVVEVKNGTDFDHFHHLPESDVLEKTERPVIGYYGAIAEWFDVELVKHCAKQYPGYLFVLIGKVTHKEISQLQDLKNVVLKGEIPYRELPRYVKFFDVCLIPFKITPLIEATNPVKFYEYLSSGKPVVSVKLPELQQYRDHCYLADSVDEFARNINLALKESKELAAPRIELAKQNSWTKRGDAFLDGIFSVFPSVTIAIVTYNNIEYSRLCYQSVKKYSRYPNLEIVFVDNNSQDGTVAWLTELKKEDTQVKVVLNSENRGFAAANNQALEIAGGEYFAFLNNDTIVTHQWIESLVRTLVSNPSIGLICPMTNVIGNEACVRAPYINADGIQPFAYEITEGKATLVRNLRSVPLFCAMISAQLLRSIGGLNEDYRMGMFEDDELSEEVKKRGLRVCYAEDTFIHHFGRASFKQLPTDAYQELFKTNRQIFESKWGKWISPIRGWFNDDIPFPGRETN
jgi:GT2 family glycosyltransferase/glycosyltransferase involved in cell wall biosynthesis